MRIVHTGDWHLGRLFHNVHLTADQAHVLDQFVDLVAEVRPHVVVIAGDLYDRAVPPPDAVDLLDDVLTRIVAGLDVPVLAIAGNHDSAARVGFAAALLRERGLSLHGRVHAEAQVLTLHDEHGPVHLCALPYADPADARAAYDDAGIHDHAAALAAGVARAHEGLPRGERRVAVAHAFVAGSLESESERPLSVGGSAEVPVQVFDAFDYAALGHLHRPQPAGRDAVRYAGSLLKYSFAEHDHRKSVSVVELGPPGKARGAAAAEGRAHVAVEEVPLSPRRDVRRLEGSLDALLAAGPADPRRDDYVVAALTDRAALYDPLGRLRAVYPNVLAIERPGYAVAGDGDADRRPRPGMVTDLELFECFFDYATGDPLAASQRSTLAEVLDELERRRREATG